MPRPSCACCGVERRVLQSYPVTAASYAFCEVCLPLAVAGKLKTVKGKVEHR